MGSQRLVFGLQSVGKQQGTPSPQGLPSVLQQKVGGGPLPILRQRRSPQHFRLVPGVQATPGLRQRFLRFFLAPALSR